MCLYQKQKAWIIILFETIKVTLELEVCILGGEGEFWIHLIRIEPETANIWKN